MKVAAHTPREFADALQALLPPGAAWEWPQGGLGDALLLGTAQELARVEGDTQGALDVAVDTHLPYFGSWHISVYRRVVEEVLAGLMLPIDTVQVDHLLRPARVGSHIGDRLWGHRARYILMVRYPSAVVNQAVLRDALDAFKQAHVFVWFEDIS